MIYYRVHMNYYGTEKYMQRISELDDKVFSKIDFSESEREKELDNGYSVKYYYYADEDNCKPGWAPEDGEICRLYHNEQPIFEWKNTDGRSRVADIIHHSDGNDYFIFDEDLYGYSVLELSSMKSMHYIPAESYAEPEEATQETFIWGDCFYNPETNLLAVNGCYWACPYSVIVLDFSNPMNPIEAEDWIDLHSECFVSNKDVGGIEFVQWKNSKMVCRADGVALESLRIHEKVEVEFLRRHQ